jgi:hypothetical protein
MLVPPWSHIYAKSDTVIFSKVPALTMFSQDISVLALDQKILKPSSRPIKIESVGTLNLSGSHRKEKILAIRIGVTVWHYQH